MFDGGLEDIVQKIIKDVVTSNVVFQLRDLGNDGLQKISQKSFARFNMSLGLFNDNLHSSINLLQDGLDSRGGSSNLSFNNSLDFVQEVNDIILNFSRFNLGFDLVENVLQLLGSFHDISDRKVFSRLQLVSKISKMFANGGDEVLNSMLQGRLEDIIQKVIKDVVTGNVVFQLRDLGNDGLQKISQKSFARFNMSLGLFNDNFDSSINLLQDGL